MNDFPIKLAPELESEWQKLFLSPFEPEWHPWIAAVDRGDAPPLAKGDIPPETYCFPEECWDKSSPLIFCAWRGNAGWIRHLLARGDSILSYDSKGLLPFHAALSRGSLECSRMLIPSPWNLNERFGEDGELPLNLVASCETATEDHLLLTEWLLDKGANPKIADKSGDIALESSAFFQELEALHLNHNGPTIISSSFIQLGRDAKPDILSNPWAALIFEKLLLLADLSDKTWARRHKKFNVELIARKKSLSERQELISSLKITPVDSEGAKKSGRL